MTRVSGQLYTTKGRFQVASQIGVAGLRGPVFASALTLPFGGLRNHCNHDGPRDEVFVKIDLQPASRRCALCLGPDNGKRSIERLPIKTDNSHLVQAGCQTMLELLQRDTVNTETHFYPIRSITALESVREIDTISLRRAALEIQCAIGAAQIQSIDKVLFIQEVFCPYPSAVVF